MLPSSFSDAFGEAWREQEAGRWDQARTRYRRILAAGHEYPEVHYNLAMVCRQAGRIDEALAAYERALVLRPDFPEAENNRGNLLRLLWRLDESEAAFRRALQLRPDFADAWNNLGATLKNQGRPTEAVAALRQGVAGQPGNPAFASNLIYAMHYDPASDAAALAVEEARWNERHAPSPPSETWPGRDRSPDRPLRIGYVAPAFCEQCQSFFTVPLFSHHDRRNFEITAYSDVASPDALTARLRSRTDRWREIAGRSDEQVDRLIREDQIDILVDLTLHSANNRLPLFTRKPAPLQLSWLGYPGDTGLDAIDHHLTDPWLEPADSALRPDSKRSIRLGDTFWCYDPLADGPPVNPLPAGQSGAVTFGCLNNFSKVNDPVLELWARVMRAVPASRLRLLAPPGETRRRVVRKIGVGPERIEFADFQPRPAYLQSYHRIDLGLDTFPYNGHTTSLDSWWMGVPVVTRCGQTPVSRAGFSQASNLRLPEFVATSPDDFVRLAAAWALDLPRLAALRTDLRRRMAQSPLMDAPRFAAQVESAYRSLWQSWTGQTRTPS